ncbi:MAG: arylsulfatase [Planctomycetaceae bacterium]|nr:arylsulfatase [Planctomycetaceae bacterium]
MLRASVAFACLILTTLIGFREATCQAAARQTQTPNILLIVADDMGYSDLDCFGGEINTPNLDAIAARGLRGTNFYVAPSCSPSRSMLLTGTDSHIAGIGNMAEWTGPTQRGNVGYEGHLNTRVVTVASLLREAGYHTYMAAKWHLGEEPDQWPAKRGFERDFALLQGAGSHWSDMLGLLPSEPTVTFTRNGAKVKELPADYYSSKYFTDFIIQSIDENVSDGRPFFAYLGYQAPHGPLAVPAEWRDKYKGRYNKGYDAIREERLARQKKLGIVGQDVVTFPRLPNIPAWQKLTDEQRRQAARKMELYAAMIEYMDDQIGRLIDHLKKTGKYDNTLLVFISDNGAAGEDMAELVSKLAPTAKDWFDTTFDNRIENWGQPRSAVEYGPAWAQISSVPFRLFKGVVTEGGIRAPLIVSGPGVKHAGTISHSVLHVMDFVPTFLESAGVEHPAKKQGSTVAPPQGKSMWPLLTERMASTRTDSDWLGWELFGNRAIRQGDWKLLYLLKGAGGTGDWQLFNLRDDPAELNDLSAKHPDKRKALLGLWDEYVKRNGVIVSEAGPYAQHQR